MISAHQPELVCRVLAVDPSVSYTENPKVRTNMMIDLISIHIDQGQLRSKIHLKYLFYEDYLQPSYKNAKIN